MQPVASRLAARSGPERWFCNASRPPLAYGLLAVAAIGYSVVSLLLALAHAFPMPAPALESLQSLVPKDRVYLDPARLAAYESDGLTAMRQVPRAVVVPESADEVIAIVRWCRDHRVPFVARGSGTSLSGGSLPVADGIVIALNRLNRILELDPVDRVAIVEPGVINLEVSRAANEFGLYFAPDPSSQTICTIGGTWTPS